MHISVTDNSRDIFKELKEIGFYGLDVGFQGYSDRDKVLAGDFGLLHKKYELIKESGLKLCQTHLTYYPGHLGKLGEGTYKDYEDYMLPMLIKEIEFASYMNCRTAIMHPYFEDSKENTRNGNIALIEKLLPVLEKNNVILSVENIYGPTYNDIHHSTAEDLLSYAKYFDSPYVGICLDTGHAVTLKQNPVEMLKKIGDYLTALHVHRTVPGHDMHLIPYYDGYYYDWDEFYDVLSASNYKGTFNMELGAPRNVSNEAVLAHYRLAYEVANSIVNKLSFVGEMLE